MIITKINVVALYGLHDYEILFDKEEPLKIIHAPNGYGKTTLLKLVKFVLKGSFSDMCQIPFKRFSIQFDKGNQVEVYRENEDVFYNLKENNFEEIYKVSVDQVKADKETACNEGLLLRLKAFTKEMPVYFIDADRLWLEKKEYRQSSFSLQPTVLMYAKELTELMSEALARSNDCGQQLDRSFPGRLIELLNSPETKAFTLETIQEELHALEAKRTILEATGLFTNQATDVSYDWSQVDDKIVKVLTLYIQDSKEKLRAFEELANKINLLCQLINKRFSYKVMEVNLEEGFIFRVPTQEKLKADKLSSGEQNELILMFKLLFKSPAHALILMDEPEISLHIAWQQSFLEDMEAIAKLTGIRMMIATHSPDIINGRWDLTTGLEEEQ